MNSNANTVETKRGLNICLANGRQPTTRDEEKCAYTRWILLHVDVQICIYIQEKEKYFMVHRFLY